MRIETIGNATLYLGDCREILPTLQRADAIITDPPYPQQFEYLYEEIARHAARILPVGGSLLTLCGHYQVPALTQKMGIHLRYWWLCGMKHSDFVRLPGKWVNAKWKPALWFVNKRRKPGDTKCPIDMIDGGGKDKKYHEWGQPTQWFSHWIENLSEPNETILDPCMGSGTTGIAALALRRKFIGIEVEEKTFDIACRRLDEADVQKELFITLEDAAIAATIPELLL